MTDNSIHGSLNDPVVAHNLGNDPPLMGVRTTLVVVAQHPRGGT